MHMDVHKTLYPFYSTKKMPYVTATVTKITLRWLSNASFSGTRLFGQANSVWPFWSEPFLSEPFRSESFRSGRLGLALSVWGHFGHETFRSDYEILQKSYMFTF